jgi:hypothetical protein
MRIHLFLFEASRVLGLVFFIVFPALSQGKVSFGPYNPFFVITGPSSQENAIPE